MKRSRYISAIITIIKSKARIGTIVLGYHLNSPNTWETQHIPILAVTAMLAALMFSVTSPELTPMKRLASLSAKDL